MHACNPARICLWISMLDQLLFETLKQSRNEK